MRDSPQASVPVFPPSADAHRELVQRIAASRLFEKSTRLRGFLLYISERYLQGRLGEINEQQIGHRVFGRREDYEPSEDNIVRVEARNLRRKLEEYFALEGKDEPVIIRIPKGGYVPVFEDRVVVPESVPPLVRVDQGSPEAPGQAAAEAAAVPASAPAPDRGKWILWLAVGLLAIGCLALAVQNLGLRAAVAAAPKPVEERQVLWSHLLTPRHHTFICLADSNLALLQDLTGRPVGLEDYIGGSYVAKLTQQIRPNNVEAILSLVASRQYTSIADAHVAGRILQSNAGFADRTTIRFARNVQIRDFSENNVVLLGSARSNPWVELFDKHLNFHIEYDPQTRRPYFRNRSPASGERAEYRNGDVREKSTEAYGSIAFLPNLNRTGNVLIIAGTNMEGTEAAGEYITNPELCARLLRKLGFEGRKTLPPFEVLLKLRAVAGASRDTEPIAFRLPKV